MESELSRSLHTGYSRAKKSNIIHYIFPGKNGYAVCNGMFYSRDYRIYYYIYPSGNIAKYDDGEIFNMGNIDILNANDYSK